MEMILWKEAGTGKSAIIAAVLLFATLAGRRNTVETMAFSGLAGLAIDGDTIHHHRGLNVPLQKLYPEYVKSNVSQVYLTLVDECSMLSKILAGTADEVTRYLRNNNNPWGGIHIEFLGDMYSPMAITWSFSDLL
jgi:hypothetical protein